MVTGADIGTILATMWMGGLQDSCHPGQAGIVARFMPPWWIK